MVLCDGTRAKSAGLLVTERQSYYRHVKEGEGLRNLEPQDSKCFPITFQQPQ